MNPAHMSDEFTRKFIPNAVQLEAVGCPLGCTPHDEAVVSGHDLLHGVPGEFTVVRCLGCGLQRTSPRPTPETICLYYPDDYGPYLGTRVMGGAGAGRGLKGWLLRIGRRIFDTKAQALPDMKPGRLLEIGCASGSYLHHMAQRGWEVAGIEFSPTAAASARALGYSVETGALETIEKRADSYDLIVGWMVLEHLHQPVQSLRKLAGWARPGAMLVVSTPNVGSMEARVFGPRWYALQLPTHLFHYDEESISHVMRASGWQVMRIYHHRTVANLLASAGYWLQDHGLAGLGQRLIQFPERGGRLGALLAFPFALPLAWVGQTGRMTIWAKLK